MAATTARCCWSWRFDMKITVTYFARPGRREEFLHRVVTAGILSAIREEDGCLR